MSLISFLVFTSTKIHLNKYYVIPLGIYTSPPKEKVLSFLRRSEDKTSKKTTS